MYLTPVVIEQSSKGERSYDIYSRLLKDRIILIFGEITDEMAASVIGQILFLASKSDSDIYLYPLTDQGIEKFQKDYKAVFGE